MSLRRILGLLLRYAYHFRASWDRISDSFYWPVLDILVWGITSSYIVKIAPNAPQIILIIMSGLLLWLVLWRAQYEISINLLEEFWNRNLVNLFVSPLKFSEWVLTTMMLGFIKAAMSLPFAAFVAYILYKFNIFHYGLYFIPFIFSLLMTGWAVGFFVSGIILRYGTRIQTLAWTTLAVISPFSAIYYPISILPEWAQKISFIVPPAYIFEGARDVLFKGTMDFNKLFMSFILNIFYISLALIFLKKSFNKILDKGLVKPH